MNIEPKTSIPKFSTKLTPDLEGTILYNLQAATKGEIERVIIIHVGPQSTCILHENGEVIQFNMEITHLRGYVKAETIRAILEEARFENINDQLSKKPFSKETIKKLELAS